MEKRGNYGKEPARPIFSKKKKQFLTMNNKIF